MQPVVSVLIPAYNHEKYVGEAVKSVLSQTYGDFELLIADDCSTDGTRRVIEGFDDPRIKTFFFEKNGGTVGALNTMLAAAKGEYIAVLGSDDVWAADKLERQLAALEQNAAAAACFTRAVIIDENSRPVEKCDHFPVDIFNYNYTGREQTLCDFFISGNHFCHSSVLIRTAAHKTAGEYRPSLRQLHDFDLWVRILLKYPVVLLEEKLVYYRIAANRPNVSGATAENNVRLFNEAKYVFADMFANITDDDFCTAFGAFFKKKAHGSKAMIKCEKFFLLWEKSLWGGSCKALALDMLMDYMNDKDFCRCMREEYGLTVNDLYKYTGRLVTACPEAMYLPPPTPAKKALRKLKRILSAFRSNK